MNVKNPYGDGNSAKRIVKILMSRKIDEKFLTKKIRF